MRLFTKAVLVAAIVLLPTLAGAQSLAGIARDASGAVLPGVTVEAASPVLIEKVRTATTDGTGTYRIENLTPGVYTTFRRHLDPAWIEEALATTGTATLRKRRLPADQVVWLVIGMALLRDRPIAEVVRQLDLAMPSADGRRTVASSSIS